MCIIHLYYTECSNLTEAKWALYICNHENNDFVATLYHYTCGNSLWQLIITLWQLSGTPHWLCGNSYNSDILHIFYNAISAVPEY